MPSMQDLSNKISQLEIKKDILLQPSSKNKGQSQVPGVNRAFQKYFDNQLPDSSSLRVQRREVHTFQPSAHFLSDTLPYSLSPQHRPERTSADLIDSPLLNDTVLFSDFKTPALLHSAKNSPVKLQLDQRFDQEQQVRDDEYGQDESEKLRCEQVSDRMKDTGCQDEDGILCQDQVYQKMIRQSILNEEMPVCDQPIQDFQTHSMQCQDDFQPTNHDANIQECQFISDQHSQQTLSKRKRSSVSLLLPMLSKPHQALKLTDTDTQPLILRASIQPYQHQSAYYSESLNHEQQYQHQQHSQQHSQQQLQQQQQYLMQQQTMQSQLSNCDQDQQWLLHQASMIVNDTSSQYYCDDLDEALELKHLVNNYNSNNHSYQKANQIDGGIYTYDLGKENMGGQVMFRERQSEHVQQKHVLDLNGAFKRFTLDSQPTAKDHLTHRRTTAKISPLKVLYESQT